MEKSDQSSHSKQHVKLSSPTDSKFINQLISNVKSDLIEITADKLENILLKHLSKVGVRKSWLTPLVLFLTVLLASLTATFSKKFGIDGPVWQAIFILGAIASLVWLLFAIFRICTCWKTCSLEYLISIIKNAQKSNQQEDTTDDKEKEGSGLNTTG